MNFRYPLILASSSPRRQFLMKEAGFQFTVGNSGIDEAFPPDLAVEEIPKYLAEKKARAFDHPLTHAIVVTSDTIVILDRNVLNKPVDRNDAMDMLTRLSGRTHRVITAVCLMDKHKVDCFDDHSEVTFRNLSRKEIETYIDRHKPFDKAGAYGAQDTLPPGLNPCSPEEIEFLQQIGKLDLIAKSIRDIPAKEKVILIEQIKGAYFTVMGLPLHKLYTHLTAF